MRVPKWLKTAIDAAEGALIATRLIMMTATLVVLAAAIAWPRIS